MLEPKDACSLESRLAGAALPLARGEAIVLVLSVLAVVVLFAALLVFTEPDARGHGTHEQLGLAPCSWPILYDRPCPTCGVTTSVAWLAHGRPLRAFWVQPFGFAIGVSLLLWAFAASRALLRRESLLARVARWPLGWLLVGAGLLLLAAWGWTDYWYEAR